MTVEGWPADDWQAYPCLLKNYRCKRWRWIKLLGDPGKLWFLHRCGEGACWQPFHIYLGTKADNEKDKYRQNPELAIRRSIMMTEVNKRPEKRAKQAVTQTGHRHTAEAKAKMSKAAMGNTKGLKDHIPKRGRTEVEAQEWLANRRVT